MGWSDITQIVGVILFISFAFYVLTQEKPKQELPKTPPPPPKWVPGEVKLGQFIKGPAVEFWENVYLASLAKHYQNPDAARREADAAMKAWLDNFGGNPNAKSAVDTNHFVYKRASGSGMPNVPEASGDRGPGGQGTDS